MRIPSATYRFQFNRDFTFRDALGLVDYLHRLGISDIYASPVLKARHGSTHGYDVTDPTLLNPELGTEEEFDRLVEELRRRDMGLLLDFVPNHMAASEENPWWRDVTEKGDQSDYARVFDTDWLGHHGIDSTGVGYRRFFDIGEMVGVRIEDRAVFDIVHEFVFRLVAEKKVTGLRLDHIDGLYRPREYLERLKRDLADVSGQPDFYVIVEKILTGGEQLPDVWPVAGTTGYEFAAALNELFLEPAGKEALKDAWATATGITPNFQDFVYYRKLQVMHELFPAEMQALGHWLARLHGALSPEDAEQALLVLSACLPVYRTYFEEGAVPERDRHYLDEAFGMAAARSEAPASALDYLRQVLLHTGNGISSEEKDFVRRWQQVTGAVMAKGYEDTSLYAYNYLVSLNEVGGNPDTPGLSMAGFHQWNVRRQAVCPFTLNATTTHDTKRSEDVRARLSVISEIPDDWSVHLERWNIMNRTKKTPMGDLFVPDTNTEILLYQTMLGAWPLEPEEEPDFTERLKTYLLKAVREAKEYTSWIAMNRDYEKLVLSFVDAIIAPSPENIFMDDFRTFLAEIEFCGALNSLTQVLLKSTCPGVPDIYRGQELWDFSLVDPDNRRPVDFRHRQHLHEDMMEEPVPVAELVRSWRDGRIKLHVTRQCLSVRRRHRRLFERGEYLPLRVNGSHGDDICAFARHSGAEWAVIAVPRFYRKLGVLYEDAVLQEDGGETWREDRIAMPEGSPRAWRNVINEAVLITMNDMVLPLSPAFRDLPLTLLIPTGQGN